MREAGLRIERAEGDIYLPRVAVSDDPRSFGIPDVALLCVKLWDVEAAARAMATVIGPETIVLSRLPPVIIFVTAYDQYALRAFEAGALDYLLKPFDDARFGRALSRAKEKLAHYVPTNRRAAERLVVRSQGQVLFLDIAEIDWIDAAGYYACLHLGGETHVLRRPLSELEQDLGEEKFTRIHRSTIVNVDRIRGLELQANGEYEVVLRSGVRLRLSRRYRKRLQDRMAALSGRD